jgi:hypothetical protein
MAMLSPEMGAAQKVRSFDFAEINVDPNPAHGRLGKP